MFAALALLFLVVPFAELYVLIQVGQVIGAGWTIVVLVLVSLTGSFLVKQQGVLTLRRAQDNMQQGVLPGVELIDGVLILFAGALLLTPGFITDFFAVLLLIPPVRIALRGFARRRLARRMNIIEVDSWGP